MHNEIQLAPTLSKEQVYEDSEFTELGLSADDVRAVRRAIEAEFKVLLALLLGGSGSGGGGGVATAVGVYTLLFVLLCTWIRGRHRTVFVRACGVWLFW
jgi:hypothetical protein